MHAFFSYVMTPLHAKRAVGNQFLEIGYPALEQIKIVREAAESDAVPVLFLVTIL